MLIAIDEVVFNSREMADEHPLAVLATVKRQARQVARNSLGLPGHVLGALSYHDFSPARIPVMVSSRCVHQCCC